MKKMKNIILIISPHPKLLGGVVNHYIGLKDFWSSTVTYEFYGKRESIPAFLTFFYDLIKYAVKLIFNRPDVVIINPSLRRYQIIRDGIYLLIANALGIKVVTFIHGWDEQYYKVLTRRPVPFRWVYNKSIFIYVLACSFKKQLLDIGISTTILLTTTKVDDKLLKNFDIKKRIGDIKNILFLARIEKEKGVLIAIDAFSILKEKYNWLTLTIVGFGSYLEQAKQYAIDKRVKDICFTGALYGMDVANEYCKSDIYILPTTHGEGMPTSVLEALVFGLPVITRPIGGINDFFDTKNMGSLIDDESPNSFARELESFILSANKTRRTALFNHKYSVNRFLASAVASNIEENIKTYLK
ncbi:glycosyltransferase family 4 protein [Flavobacterium sp. LAR06]|uniref:glycosyltransferase family 4 protein n=1 Tax=Flavobacterium sp. LAR06 TaxID=3064897 RepID=UPI0035C11D51